MGTETTITIKEGNVDVNAIDYDYVSGGTTGGQNYYDTPIKGDALTIEEELEVKKGEQVKIIKVKYNARRGVIERKDVSELTPIIFKTADEQRGTDTIDAIETENDELSLRDELLEEESGENSCFLDGEEIENGSERDAYKLNSADSHSQCESASNKISRICNEGVLSGEPIFKYKNCSVAAALTCGPENMSGYIITDSGVAIGDDSYGYKEINDAIKGNIKYKNKYECQASGTFAFYEQKSPIGTCNAGYEIDTSIDELGCIAVAPLMCSGSYLWVTYSAFLNPTSTPVGTPTIAEYSTIIPNGRINHSAVLECNSIGLIPTYELGTLNPDVTECPSLDYNPIGDSCIENTMGVPWILEGFATLDSDLKMYKESGHILGTGDSLSHQTPGVKIYGTNSHLAYNTSYLGLSGDFVIEMEATVPDDGTKHYLINANNFNLFVDGGVLKFNDGINDYPYSHAISVGSMQNVKIKRNPNKIWIKYGSNSWEELLITNDITYNEIVFGAFEIGGNYYGQLDNIINYIKIYK